MSKSSSSTVRRIQQVVGQLVHAAVCENDVREILDMLMRRHLVIRDDDRYLGLPFLTYRPASPIVQPARRFVPAAASSAVRR